MSDITSINQYENLQTSFFDFYICNYLSCKVQIKSDLQFVYTVDKEGVYLCSLPVSQNDNRQIVHKSDSR